MIVAGADLVVVFDGSDKPLKRGRQRGSGRLFVETAELRNICECFRIPWTTAAAEGEAECAYLQREGTANFVFSNDADCLAFGATKVVMYASERTTEDASEIASDEESDTETVTEPVSRRARVTTKSGDRPVRVIDVNKDAPKWTQLEYVLRIILQGGDYDEGVARIGAEIARDLAQPGSLLVPLFADAVGWDTEHSVGADPTLEPEAAESDDAIEVPRENLDIELEIDDSAMERFREQLLEELRTNKSGLLSRKQPALADKLAQRGSAFPDREFIGEYLTPRVNRWPKRFPETPELPVLALAWDEWTRVYGSAQADWKNFVRIVLAPMVVRHIRNGTDKDEWYDSLSEKKYRNAENHPGHAEYAVKLRSAAIPDILGIRQPEWEEDIRYDPRVLVFTAFRHILVQSQHLKPKIAAKEPKIVQSAFVKGAQVQLVPGSKKRSYTRTPSAQNQNAGQQRLDSFFMVQPKVESSDSKRRKLTADGPKEPWESQKPRIEPESSVKRELSVQKEPIVHEFFAISDGDDTDADDTDLEVTTVRRSTRQSVGTSLLSEPSSDSDTLILAETSLTSI